MDGRYIAQTLHILGALALGLTMAAADSPSDPKGPAVICSTDPSTGSPVRVIVRAAWSRIPSGDDMARAYPREAWYRHVGALAKMNCSVTDLRLTDCRIIEDDGAALGFDEATLSLAQFFRMRPLSTYDLIGGAPGCAGQLVPLRVIIPVRWILG